MDNVIRIEMMILLLMLAFELQLFQVILVFLGFFVVDCLMIFHSFFRSFMQLHNVPILFRNQNMNG